MLQYRIVEKQNDSCGARKFYPEVKKYFFWWNIKVNDKQVIENFYNTYEEAKEFILSKMPKVLFHCVEHPFEKNQKIYHINPKKSIFSLIFITYGEK